MNEKEFEKLLGAYLDGDISDKDVVKLKEAVESVPGYRHQFQKEMRLHTLLREVTAEQMEQKKMSAPRRRRAVAKKKRKPILAFVLAAAAAIAIVGMVTAAIIHHNQPQPVGVCVFVTNEGQHELIRGEETIPLRKNLELLEGDRIVNDDQGKTMLSLNDGSVVSLEQNTELVLSESEAVQVALHRGEIFLEVEKRGAGDDPFKVRTPDSTLTVLGTIFSVCADARETRLSVYEGRVELDRATDDRKAYVQANQFVVTNDRSLTVKPIKPPEPEVAQPDVIDVLPTDDAYIQERKAVNSKELRVRGQCGGESGRVSYMRFRIENLGPIKKAVLHLTQTIDPGSGTLRFYLGSHTDWSEKDLTRQSAPVKEKQIAKRKGAILPGETIRIDLSKAINDDGVYTIIMTLDESGHHDVWFSSREGAHPPKLRLTR